MGADFENWALGIGVVLFVSTALGLYRLTQRSAEDRNDSRPGPAISR